jgi:type VII secretion-associated protein (TIGR03931 family)
VTAHVLEIGPCAIRRLCCGGEAIVDREIESAAFESIDDPVALVDLRPVAVESLWRTVLASVDCGSAETATVVHPSWWARPRVDVLSAASQVIVGEVVMRPRSWLLSQACPSESRHATVVVEIADCFVVITGAAVVAETRGRDQRCVVDAIVRSVLEMAADSAETVIIDAPSTVQGASALAAMIADGLRDDGGMTAMQVDDARLRELAGEIILGESRACDSNCTDAARRDHRRHWRLALVVPVVSAVLGVSALSHHGAPAGDGISTTFLVEGHVALEVPARWQIRRIVAGPGSARVQVTSPADPEVALHVTQSRVALPTLSATAEFLKHAIDVETTGTFVDFNPTGRSAGRPAVTYREVRPGHDVRWTVLVDKDVRISIGCQSRHGHDDAVRQVCELAVRSARALS